MTLVLINVQLSVELKDDLLIAHTLFINDTPDIIHLDRMTLGADNDMKRNVFNITDERGAKISYTGAMVKRQLSLDEFILLNVGEKIATTFVLNNIYRVQKGIKYIIQYDAYNPESLNDNDPLIKMKSNKVEILYS